MRQTISEDYMAEQARLHATYIGYGVASMAYAPQVSDIINEAGITTLLDYGCGKARLAKSLQVNHEVQMRLYDPGIPDYAHEPHPAQMVTCIDVLEHIEPEFLDNVLDELQRLTGLVGFFTVHTGPAMKTLSDGRNAHLTQQPMEWWLPKFEARFEIFNVAPSDLGFTVVALRKQASEEAA